MVAIISLRPLDNTRVSVPRAISTKIIDPSGIAIGPSGKSRSSVTILNSDIPLPLMGFLGDAAFNIFCYIQCMFITKLNTFLPISCKQSSFGYHFSEIRL